MTLELSSLFTNLLALVLVIMASKQLTSPTYGIKPESTSLQWM